VFRLHYHTPNCGEFVAIAKILRTASTPAHQLGEVRPTILPTIKADVIKAMMGPMLGYLNQLKSEGTEFCSATTVVK
jgi:hypothetical protein